MRINYYCIYWLFIVFLAFQSASGQNVIADKIIQNISVNQSDLRTENLKKQASEYFEAYDKSDVDRLVELTHPKSFEKDGSRENFAKMMKHFLKLFSEVYEFRSSLVESSSGLFEIDNYLFGVVPYKLEGIRNFEKNKVVKLSSIVGISSDNGKNWKFVNGLAFSELFPDVAKKVQIPNERQFINGKEQ